MFIFDLKSELILRPPLTNSSFVVEVKASEIVSAGMSSQLHSTDSKLAILVLDIPCVFLVVDIFTGIKQAETITLAKILKIGTCGIRQVDLSHRVVVNVEQLSVDEFMALLQKPKRPYMDEEGGS